MTGEEALLIMLTLDGVPCEDCEAIGGECIACRGGRRELLKVMNAVIEEDEAHGD